MRQFQPVEDEIEKLFPAQGEGELIHAFALVGGSAFTGTAIAPSARTRQSIPFDELLVAWTDDGAPAPRAVLEDRLGNIATGDRDLLATLHVCDRTTIDRFLYRALDMRPVAVEKTLTIHRALVLGIGASINEIAHVDLLVRAASLRFSYPQIPLGEQPHLLLGIATLAHAGDEILMLLLIRTCSLGVERDEWQHLLSVGEHLVVDHPAQLPVGFPAAVHAVVLGTRPQHEVDHLVAEILGIGVTRRLLDLLQFIIERLAVKQPAGLG